MLASKNEIMHFFEQEGFLQSLWLGWDGDQDDYWEALNQILVEVWDKYGEEQGYISYDDVEEIQEYMVQRLQQLDTEETPYVDSDEEITQRMTTSLGDIDLNLNESTGLSKRDIERIVRDEVKKHLAREKYLTKKDVKDYLDKDEVKKIIRKAIVDQYKVLWMKSSFYINQI